MKALLLLSSGIDSPVAGRMMKDRGVEVVAVHFKLFDSKKEEQKVIDLAKKVDVKQLFFADLRPCHHVFKEKGNARFTCVFCKRMMLRFAERLAEKENCDFLVTGESLGQVASQTLANMMLINMGVKINVFAPLLGFDKQEAVNLAKKYGTYELSIRKSPSCPFLPRKPLTKANLEKLEQIEQYVNVNELIEKSYKTITQVL